MHVCTNIHMIHMREGIISYVTVCSRRGQCRATAYKYESSELMCSPLSRGRIASMDMSFRRREDYQIARISGTGSSDSVSIFAA